MNKNKVKKDGRVWELKKVIIITNFLSPNYTISPHSHNKLTETGLLTVAELSLRNSSLPKFVFRWDEPVGELDVDIYEKGKINNALWSNGHSGHHTRNITLAAGRVFRAEINSPSGKVFEGSIKVPVIRAETGNIKIVCKISAIEKYIKGKRD